MNNLESFLAADEAAKHKHHMDLLARRDMVRAKVAKELEEKQKIQRSALLLLGIEPTATSMAPRHQPTEPYVRCTYIVQRASSGRT